MIEVSIYIPIAGNDGETFGPEHHEAFESFVLERFGGITRDLRAVEGVWKDQGRTYADRNRVYHVAVKSLLDGGTLREVIHFAKRHYRQEAIFFRYLGIAEIE